jgi:hypothetical protein
VVSLLTDTLPQLTLPPLDRLTAGFFATNPNATTATFSSGNLTLTLSRLDPSASLALNAGPSGAILPVLPGVPAGAVVYLASQPFSAASAAAFNLTGASTSLGISSAAGQEVVIRDLAEPVIVKFAAATNASSLECTFYNETAGIWSTDGCQTVFVAGQPTCQCDHLTEFGLRFKAIAATNEGIFGSLGKLLTLEGLMAALPIIILIASIGGSLVGILIVLRFLDHRAFRSYAVSLDSSAELELLRGRIREMRPDQSWDCLKIQGRHSPVVPGFKLHQVPTIPTRWYHLIGIWARRFPFQHPWFGLFTRFDPAMPRIYRGILLSVGLLTSVSLSILFYGYSNGAVGDSELPPMALTETIVLSLITTAASVPVAFALNWAAARSGHYEFMARYPYILAELTKLRQFVNVARSLPRLQLVEEMALYETKLFPMSKKTDNVHFFPSHTVDDIYNDPTIDVTPDAAAVISATITNDPGLNVGITGVAQALLTCLCSREARNSLKAAYCPNPQVRFRRGILQFIRRYTHVHAFRSRAGKLCGPAWLPIHTPTSTALTILLFAWMGACCTYILGFTSYQSSDATFTIFKSVAISQLTSNLIVGPATQFISLLLPYLHQRHEGPEEAIFLPLEVFEFKVLNSFVARASACQPNPIAIMPPDQIMKKLDTDLSEEGQRLEARLQNIFWAID